MYLNQSRYNIMVCNRRPVNSLYLVIIKYECDEKRSNCIRQELIREFDGIENDSIPTIEVHSRPSQIIFNHIHNGLFGLSLDEHLWTLYDNENKKYIYTNDNKHYSEHFVEMINDLRIIFIALINCLRERNDVDLLNIFNNEI
ncbi:unnamed protein product [Rotaria sp. Silwood2]|nr:unnamed protein product [Rotaria sp. Silwood2]CAF3231618.1 unnamed protein product [Rotaria sp. Silwood2]CAF4019082.1 unnamed protein product [Rotaria sp. Silwood2]CAF4435773.1 unnamed protein product [Rotaria sp. Silwood2]